MIDILHESPVQCSIEVINAALDVILFGSSEDNRSKLPAALNKFEALSKGDPAVEKISDTVGNNFELLKEAIRLAQSVTHNEPLPLLGQLLGLGKERDRLIQSVRDALDESTPQNTKHFANFVNNIRTDHPVLYVAAMVLAYEGIDPGLDLAQYSFPTGGM